MFFMGIRKGKFILIAWKDDDKNFATKSVITSLFGCTINNKEVRFSIKVQFFQKIKGDDSKLYSKGLYTYEQFKKAIISEKDEIPYIINSLINYKPSKLTDSK